jgi:thioredoxin reductase (NADPH)
VIIASGSTLNKLNVPGENEFVGACVSYCATCDGAFFIDQNVCVAGGGDSALQEAITLTEFASNVDLFCRSSSLQAQQILQDRITDHEKIQVHLNVEVQEIHGDSMFDGVSLLQTVSGESKRVNIDTYEGEKTSKSVIIAVWIHLLLLLILRSSPLHKCR